MYSTKDLLNGAKKMAESVFGQKDEYIISFTKEDDGCWYVDFPDWPFDHHNLMMVSGADKLCELLSYDGKHTKVKVFVPINGKRKICQSHDINEEFELIRGRYGLTEGATYQVNLNQFKEYGGFLWLCPVTLFVLGKYPECMYITRLQG